MINNCQYKKESMEIQNILKGLAIICVVSAHSHVSSNIDSSSYEFMENILCVLGTIGVPCFFIISGYVFTFNKMTFIKLMKKKFMKLGIPWIISGLLVKGFYTLFFREKISFMKFIIKAIFFNAGSYYLVMLFIYYAIFYFIKKDYILYILLFISIINQMFISNLVEDNFYNYYNPLNWMVFFLLGYIFEKKNLVYKLIQYIKKYFIYNIILFVIITFFMCLKRYKMNYWSSFYIPYALLSFLVLLEISIKIKYKNKKLKRIIENIGKNSFFIYLFNFPLATLFSKILTLYFSVGIIFAPIITIIFMMLVVKLLNKISLKKDYFVSIKKLLGILN